MRIRPRQRLPFRLEKSVDDQGTLFIRSATANSRSFSVSHCAPRIDGCQCFATGQDNATSIRDVPRIHCAVPGAQSRARSATMIAGVSVGTGSAACPVNGDARQLRIVFGKNSGRDKAKNEWNYLERVHNFFSLHGRVPQDQLADEATLRNRVDPLPVIDSELRSELVPSSPLYRAGDALFTLISSEILIDMIGKAKDS